MPSTYCGQRTQTTANRSRRGAAGGGGEWGQHPSRHARHVPTRQNKPVPHIEACCLGVVQTERPLGNQHRALLVGDGHLAVALLVCNCRQQAAAREPSDGWHIAKVSDLPPAAPAVKADGPPTYWYMPAMLLCSAPLTCWLTSKASVTSSCAVAMSPAEGGHVVAGPLPHIVRKWGGMDDIAPMANAHRRPDLGRIVRAPLRTAAERLRAVK